MMMIIKHLLVQGIRGEAISMHLPLHAKIVWTLITIDRSSCRFFTYFLCVTVWLGIFFIMTRSSCGFLGSLLQRGQQRILLLRRRKKSFETEMQQIVSRLYLFPWYNYHSDQSLQYPLDLGCRTYEREKNSKFWFHA